MRVCSLFFFTYSFGCNANFCNFVAKVVYEECNCVFGLMPRNSGMDYVSINPSIKCHYSFGSIRLETLPQYIVQISTASKMLKVWHVCTHSEDFCGFFYPSNYYFFLEGCSSNSKLPRIPFRLQKEFGKNSDKLSFDI